MLLDANIQESGGGGVYAPNEPSPPGYGPAAVEFVLLLCSSIAICIRLYEAAAASQWP